MLKFTKKAGLKNLTKISQLIRYLVSKRKIKWEISSIFIGLLENLNYIYVEKPNGITYLHFTLFSISSRRFDQSSSDYPSPLFDTF